MPTARVVEGVDILEERGLGFSPCRPCVPPDQFGFQRFEEGLNGRIIVTISFAAHRHLKALLAQAFLIVMTAILAAPVGMVNASRCWLAQVDRHVEGADRKVLLHAIADRPADDAPGIEIENDGQIEPSLAGPDVRDITGPFLVRPACREVPVQQVGRYVEPVIAIGRCLVFARADDTNVILLHQSTDAPMADIQTKLFQLFGHARAAI